MAYVGDELPKPFSNLTEKSYVPLAIGFWDTIAKSKNSRPKNKMCH